ncbi:hypothetical protein RDM67_05020, partial [Pseudomonas aeruginosa]
LEHLPQRTGLQLLAGVRNLNASRVADNKTREGRAENRRVEILIKRE